MKFTFDQLPEQENKSLTWFSRPFQAILRGKPNDKILKLWIGGTAQDQSGFWIKVCVASLNCFCIVFHKEFELEEHFW